MTLKLCLKNMIGLTCSQMMIELTWLDYNPVEISNALSQVIQQGNLKKHSRSIVRDCLSTQYANDNRLYIYFIIFSLFTRIINSTMNKPRELIMRGRKYFSNGKMYLRYDSLMEWFLTEPAGLIN